MRKKQKYIKDLTIGESLNKEIFSIKNLCEEKNGEKKMVLADNSGAANASVALCNLQCELLEGSVVEISGLVLAEGRDRLLRIKEIAICTDFLPAELFQCLSQTTKDECKAGINDLKSKIMHPGYRALVDACLTDAVLDRMAELPATLNLYGKYNGGALVATNAVGHMALTSMVAYSKRGNSLTTTPPSWSALTTASLLFLYGNIEFFTPQPPYKRTKVGIDMGYASLLQKMIEDAIHKNNILLSDADLAKLLNILKSSVEDKTSVKATSKDGAILRHTISLYSDCDSFDWELATHEDAGENGYFYSTHLNRYVVRQEV